MPEEPPLDESSPKPAAGEVTNGQPRPRRKGLTPELRRFLGTPRIRDEKPEPAHRPEDPAVTSAPPPAGSDVGRRVSSRSAGTMEQDEPEELEENGDPR